MFFVGKNWTLCVFNMFFVEPSGSQLPIDQVTIDPWFQIYRELEDEG